MKDSFRHTPFRREQPPNAQRGGMELWLSYIEKSPRNQTPFMFYVVDADTGYGLKGAEFSLFQRDELAYRKLFQPFRCCMVSAAAGGTVSIKRSKATKTICTGKRSISDVCRL